MVKRIKPSQNNYQVKTKGKALSSTKTAIKVRTSKPRASSKNKNDKKISPSATRSKSSGSSKSLKKTVLPKKRKQELSSPTPIKKPKTSNSAKSKSPVSKPLRKSKSPVSKLSPKSKSPAPKPSPKSKSPAPKPSPKSKSPAPKPSPKSKSPAPASTKPKPSPQTKPVVSTLKPSRSSSLPKSNLPTSSSKPKSNSTTPKVQPKATQAKVEPPKADENIVKALRKGRAAVDVECPKAKDCHILEEGSNVWTTTLNQADLKNNANKYYIIQLLQSDVSPSIYYVWNRWGRVGYVGQNALKGPFSDLNRAKSDYQSKFRDKTKNGYIEIKIAYEEENEPKTPVKNIKSKGKDVKSSLDTRVADFVNLIFDLKSINRTLAEIGYDSKKMPLGKLSIATINQGLGVLKEIENALNGKKKDSLTALSSQFYSLIPHDFGFQNMAKFIIATIPKVKEKVEMLENLADMKIATNILESSSEGNPVDSYYKKLNCKIVPLEKKDPAYELLSNYVQTTHGQTHSSYKLIIEEIFRVEKPGEKEKFTTKLDNHMLLWHGSRLTNWVGILSQGLRIAPPEAPVSGYMFGKGVYFADMISKSANYCFTSKENNTGVLLLCEVALGNFNEKIHSDYNAGNLPKNKHSTKGCGINAPPESNYKNLEGCKVPMGPSQTVNNGGWLQYNEYIVYNTNQIKMKFLFRVKFKYNY
jgi:poly [ADP-ribose] polymerase 2/3/4